MSKEALARIVTKAVQDRRFRTELLRDPKGTLADVDLTRAEYAALTQLDDASFDYLSKGGGIRSAGIIVNGTTVCVGKDPVTLSRYRLADLTKVLGS